MRTLSLPIRNHTADYVQSIELTFQCPVCLAIETLFLEDGMLTDTKHWKQFKGKIYHRDCGRPARLINLSKRNKMFIPSNTTILLVRMLEQRQETTGQFAVKMGVSRITVKRWLQGKCYPNGISRRKLARYAKTPPGMM